MRILFYVNLIAIVVIAGALARLYEGTPLPWVHATATGHAEGTATPEPNPVRLGDAAPGEDLRVLTEGAYPPFNGRNAKGELNGYDVDMAHEICVRLQRRCVFETRTWKKLLPALKREEADIVVASMLVPKAKGIDGVIFSDPYYRTPGHFAARRDGRLGSGAAALAKQTVAVQSGSTHEAFLKARFPKVKRLAVATLDEAEAALVDRRADLVFADRNALLNWMKRGGGDGCCQMVGGDYDDPAFFAPGAGIALRSGDEALRSAVNDALSDIKRDGTEARIARPYFGQSIQ
jgi:ABC-type amino acid transport substrate-binding protein